MATCGHGPATDAGAEKRGGPRVYERRDVESDTLHQVVRENLATFTAAIEAGFAGSTLPDFVRAELAGYVDCGVLGRGFAHFFFAKDAGNPGWWRSHVVVAGFAPRVPDEG